MMNSKSVGLPKSVDYELPPSIPEECVSRFVSISPNGITQTAAVSIPTTSYTAASGGPVFPFSQQLIAFDIPCNQGITTFIDPTQTLLNFRMVLTVTTAQAGGTGAVMSIISSMAGWISQLSVVHNNIPIEVITNYDQIYNILLNSTLTLSNRNGSGFAFGCDTNTYSGIDLVPTTAGTYYYNCSIPLLSVLGVNGGDKLFPIGVCNNLQVQLLTNTIMPISTYCTVIPTTMPVANVVLDNWTLSLKYIDLGSSMASMLGSLVKDEKIYIKCSSYATSNTTLPTSSAGNQSVVINTRLSSIKSVYMTFTLPLLPARCPNGVYDSVNPHITYLQLVNPATGLRVPNKPLNPSERPAEAFTAFQQSLGSSSASSYSGIVCQETYFNIFPAPLTTYDSRWVQPASALRTAYGDNTAENNIAKYPNMFYVGLDLERVSSSLFSGVSTRSSPPQIDLFLNTTITSTVGVNVFSLYDMVLAFDVSTRTITPFN